LSHRDESPDFLAVASFTKLPQASTGTELPESFKLALEEFVKKHPEIDASPLRMEFLQYCYQHYVNFDPKSRDLSVPEKLEHAAQMASEFWSKMFQV
jgi:hypothetical protein